MTVTVTAVNDLPVGTPLPARSANDGASVNLDLSGFFSDVDGDTLAYSQTGLPSGLSISPSGVISGTIDNQASRGGPNGNGVYTVTVSVADGHGGTAQQSFTLTVSNPAPIAVNDTAVTNEDRPVTINVLANDSDPDGDPLTVVSATAANGSVTILTDGEISYQPSANFNGTDTITYTISDGNGGTATGTVTVTVNPVNDEPVGSPIADRTRNDGDTDSFDLSAFFSDPEGGALTYSIDPNTPLPPGLTLVGSTITGRITPDASGPDGEKTYHIRIIATDDGNLSTDIEFNYTVLNIAPIANDDSAETNEDTPVDINILANDSDPDGDTVEVIRVNNVVLIPNGAAITTTNGSVRLIENADGSQFLRFTPNPDYNGQESFNYSVDDGNGGVDTATVTIKINPVNDLPVGQQLPDRVRADGQSFTYDVGDFFSDPDGDSLTFTVDGLPAGLQMNANGLIFGNIDHNASQGGPDGDGVYTVTIIASDGKGGTATRTFELQVTNPAPTAHNDLVTIDEDVAGGYTFNPITGEGTDNPTAGADIDPDGDPLTIIAASAGAGTVTINGDGTLTYLPALNFNGTDTIVYTISDGNGGVSTATVRVTVNPVNDRPTAAPVPDQYDSDGQTVDYDVSPYFNDVDGDTLSFSATGLPAGLSIDANGRITGTLAADASNHGPYTIAITATDGALSVTQNVTWIVTNLPPKAFHDTLTVDEDTAGTGNVLTNDADPDGDRLTIDQVEGSAANVGTAIRGSNGGTFLINADGTYTFDPGTDFDDMSAGDPPRTTTITYRVTDGTGFDTATLTVTVTGVNDDPTADPIPDYTRADGESLDDHPLHLGAFFQDVDANDRLTFSASSLPAGLSMDQDGTITGTIASNASQGGNDGVYTVTVTATDLSGAIVTQDFTFTVTNPAPIAVNDTVETGEDQPVTFNPITGLGTTSGAAGVDIDPDGDTLSLDPDFTPVAGHGTVTVNADGTLTYTPNPDYNGTDTIVYRITDGQGGLSTGIITVSVDAENDAPVSSVIADIDRNDGETISMDLSGHFVDPEGDTLTYSASGLPPGLLINPATGVITGRITHDASGPMGVQNYIVEITATDPDGASATERFTYTVRNIPPIAENDIATTPEDTPVDIDILANDRDPDGDSDTVILIDGVNLTVGGGAVRTANGSVQLVLDAAGREILRFTPNPDYNGTEQFTYTISDGNGGSDTATVTIIVQPVNDAPVATTIPDRTLTDSADFSLDVRPFFSDVDGQALTITVSGLPQGLTFDPATGVISGTLGAAASQASPYTITVTASDGTASAASTFRLTVTNPAPEAANDTVDTQEDTPVTFNPITGSGTTSGADGIDRDPDGDPLTITQIDGQAIAINQTIAAAGGSVTLIDASGTLTFTPAADFNGTVGFTYRLSDGNGGFSDASVTLNIAAVNDLPVVDLNGTATAGTDNQVSFTEGGGPVPVVTPDAIISDVEGGITSVGIDLGGFRDTGSEVIHLNGSVDLVFGTASSGTIAFGGTTFFYRYDGATALHFENAAGNTVPMPDAAASALLRAIQYENRSNNLTAGDRTLTVTVTDNQGGETDAVVTVSVGAVNDPPVAVADTAVTEENTAIVNGPSVLANDSDPEGSALTVVAVGTGNPGDAITGSAGGTFIMAADGTWQFNPGTAFDNLQVGQTRDTVVTYTVADASGATSTATLTVTVTGSNDDPAGGSFTLNAVEDTVATGFLPVTDADADADADTLTYALASQPAHGSVTIGADGSYAYVPAADFAGADSFTYTVGDGRTSVTFTVSVNVANVQDPPAGSVPDQAFSDAQTVNLDIAQFFSDADGDTLAYSHSGLPTGLSMSTTGLITGTLRSDASQLNGGAYVVTVSVSDGQGNTISRDFTITVSNPAPVAQNDAITTEENTVATGSVFADHGSGVDFDPDGDQLSVAAVNGAAAGVGTSVTGTAGGAFVIGADGSYRFDPGTDFDDLATGQTRATSITYTLSDGQGGTSTATFTVTVTGTNDAPAGQDFTLNATEDTPVNATLPTATDAEGQPLTYAAGSQPKHGSITINANGTYTYTPAPDFFGTDTFTYTVSDGTAVSTYTVTVNVAGVNDAPALGNDTFTIDEDGSGIINVLANDRDADGDTLTITAIDGQAIATGGSVAVTGGTVTLNADRTLTFTATPNFNGPLSFTYTVSDGTGGPNSASTATVSGFINPVNDAPIAQNDSAATDENTIVGGNVIIGSDSDPDGDTLTVIQVGTGPDGVGATLAGDNGGRFVILADGSYSFNPGADFKDLQAGETRATAITYTVSDGNGGTAFATLTVTVSGVNDAPQAPTLPPRTDADNTAVTLDLGALFSDVDGDALFFTISGLPTGLTYDPATGLISGTIDRSASGPTGSQAFTVTATATDGHGGSVERQFVWTVTNPAPVAQNDSFSINEGQSLTGSVLANNGNGVDSDPDGDPLTVSPVSGPAHGTLTLNTDGTFTYQPAAFFNGTDSFTYQISDGNGGVSTATVTIRIAAVNDAPQPGDDTFTIDEDGSAVIAVLANDIDPDGDALTITAIDNRPITTGASVAVTGGIVTLNAGGTLIFTANPDFNGTPSFTYTVSDGTVTRDATVFGTVNAVNDAPVNTLPGSFAGREDTDLQLTGIAISDVDADNGTMTVTLGVNAGSLIAFSGGNVVASGTGTANITLTGTLADINAYLAGPTAPTYRPVTDSNAAVTLTMTTDDGGNSGAGGALTATSVATILIDPVNDAPVASDQRISTAEDTPVEGTIAASDVDGDPLSYVVVTQPANGRVTIDTNGRYVYTPGSNFNGTDSFAVTISDGHGGIATATVTIDVAPVNDAPVGADLAITIREDQPLSGRLPVATDPEGAQVTYGTGTPPMHGTLTVNPDGTYSYSPAANFNGTDSFTYTVSDGTAVSTYTVTITIDPVNDAPIGSDLQIAVANGAVASGTLPPATDPEGGTVAYAVGTVNNGATVVIGANGSYLYTPRTGFSGVDTFTYTVSDGTDASTYTVTVTVGAANQPPTAGNDSVDAVEDTPLDGELPAATDYEGQPITYALGAQAAHGQVTVNADGTYRYVPNPNFNGVDSFTFTVSDGTASSVYTITIRVAAVDDAPVGSGTSIAVTEDVPATGTLPRAFDPEGLPVTYSADTQPANGSVTVNPDGTYRYVPNANFHGTDSFTFKVSDGQKTSVFTVNVTVTATNDVPVGANVSISTNEDTAFNGQFSATDGDNDPLTYSLGSGPAHGSVTVDTDGRYTYTPNADFHGTDTFTYKVSDGTATVAYTVTVTVLPINDAPTGADGTAATDEDTVLQGRLPIGSDPDGDPLFYSLAQQAQHGTVTINLDGTYAYVPDANFNGTDTFQYTVSDGQVPKTYTITVTVRPVNDAPVGTDIAESVGEDGRVTGTIPPATDVDNDTLTYGLGRAPAHGTATVSATGQYTYVPNPDFNGTDTFTYGVNDGTVTVFYTITVTVRPVNDAPVGRDTTVLTPEDTPLSGRLPVATDVDGDTLTYGLGQQAGHGTVTINADGTYRYVPARNFNGTDTFTYTVSDGTATSTYTVTVTVAAVNDAPVGSDTAISVTEGTTATGSLPPAIDPEGDAVTYGLGQAAQHGTVTINADGTYRYTPDAGYRGSDSFTYTVGDGRDSATYTVTISVGAANRPPVGSDTRITVTEDTRFTGRLPVATDADGDDLAYGIGARPVHGTVTINENGTYAYVPARNFSGVDTFTYTVSDGKAVSTYTVTVVVDPVNDAPVASDTKISVTEGTSSTGRLPPAIDAEGDPITYGLGRGAQHGSVTVNPDGSYRYTPDSGYSGSDTFTYTVSDGSGSSIYTVTVTVDPAEPATPPRPPLEIDPPTPIPTEPTVSWTPMSPSQAVSAGSPLSSDITSGLNGIADLTAQGPIVNVVNSIRSLNGMGWLPDRGAVVHVAGQIGEWQESGRIIDEVTAGFFKGGSNIHLARGNGETTWFQIDTMVYNDYLYIMPSSDGGVENASFGVTLADGSPLPVWLKPTRQGLVVGRPPAGLPFIDLRIHGSSQDGVISDTVRIDLHTGAVLDHVSDRRSELDPGQGLFSDHLYAAANGGEEGGLSMLAYALENWSELLER